MPDDENNCSRSAQMSVGEVERRTLIKPSTCGKNVIEAHKAANASTSDAETPETQQKQNRTRRKRQQRLTKKLLRLMKKSLAMVWCRQRAPDGTLNVTTGQVEDARFSLIQPCGLTAEMQPDKPREPQMRRVISRKAPASIVAPYRCALVLTRRPRDWGSGKVDAEDIPARRYDVRRYTHTSLGRGTTDARTQSMLDMCVVPASDRGSLNSFRVRSLCIRTLMSNQCDSLGRADRQRKPIPTMGLFRKTYSDTAFPRDWDGRSQEAYGCPLYRRPPQCHGVGCKMVTEEYGDSTGGSTLDSLIDGPYKGFVGGIIADDPYISWWIA
ncbi:hypothetical protein CTRI78_v003088 [Colletotrichum trifolii]|uniref:Uncharacterized protein n=1 Tax=Colletotrichum trifolii TaxID=5466 RepID=A0A4R8RWB8_COLTR|nr:hypothetical protein CTRI78_v003088 [Colletotrichum trifolii]